MPDLQTAINSVSTPPVSVQGVPPVAAPKAARGATAMPDIAAESERQQKEIRGYYDPLYASGRTQKEQIQTERERQLGLPEMQVPKADLQAPVFHPTEMKDMGGILMVLGALAGRKTMAPATAAMNNMAAMMEGMHQGDMEKYNRELATFKDNLAIVKERASEVEKRRKEIIENAKGDMAAIDRNMTELARQEGMDLNMLRQSIQVPEFMMRMQMQMAHQLAQLDKHQAKITAPEPNEIQNQIALARAGLPKSQIVGGWGKDATAQWARIEAGAIDQIMKEHPGMSRVDAAKDFSDAQIGLKGESSSVMQLTKMLGATKQAVNQLDYNIDQTKKAMDALPSTDILPVLNAIARGEEKWTGNPAYNRLFFFLSATATEAARIMSGGQASVAQLHEGARLEASKWMDINMTPKSFKEGVAPALLDESKNRIKQYEDAIDYMQQRRRTPSESRKEITPTKTPSGATVSNW